MIRAALAALWIGAGPALALDLTLPSTARQTAERNTAPDIYEAPIGAYRDGMLPVVAVEGEVRRSAWKLSSPGLTPFQVMRPLRAQLVDAGFEIALECRARACGGFDFRFATETLPGPDMYVNIRAFQFVTGVRERDGKVAEVVTLLASTADTSAYVQIIQAGNPDDPAASVSTTGNVPLNVPVTEAGDFIAQLVARGHAVLPNLDFETGSTDLGAGPFQALADLAQFLSAEPGLRVAVVGHTDTVGGLQTNIAISRARARSVRQRLIGSYNIDGARLDAEGMGYLAPYASNLTPEGREQNRRVEIVLLSSE